MEMLQYPTALWKSGCPGLKTKKTNKFSLQDRRRSGRPSSAVNPGNSDEVEKLITDDRRITIDDIAERVGVSHGSAVNIVNELGFAKICTRWVPRQLLDFLRLFRAYWMSQKWQNFS